MWEDDRPTDRKTLDRTGRWGEMPFLMLAKCAEAQALRKAWPEDLANTFVGEEVARATLDPDHDLSAPAAAARGAAAERLDRIQAGDNRLIIDWLRNEPLDAVPIGKLADRILAFIRETKRDADALAAFQSRNRHSLREFWARAPTDALHVKRELEKAQEMPHQNSDGRGRPRQTRG